MNTTMHTTEENTKRYVVSLFSETWTESDYGAGETDTKDIVVDHEAMGWDDMKAVGRKVTFDAFDAASGLLSTTYPDENRAFFEAGAETFYTMVVHSVDDRPPSAADYAELGKLFNVRMP